MVLSLDIVRVGRRGKKLIVESDVAWVLHRVELVPAWMGEDGDASLSEHRLVPIEVEKVAEAHTHDKDRVHRRVDVVGTEVGHANGDDIRLALDTNADLVAHRFQRILVDL